MNRFTVVIIGLAAMLFLAGCTVPRLQEGRYSDIGCDDYILVNNDLIFMHIRTPREYPTTWAYWDWAGKYTLTKDGVLIPDMDDETWKLWRFYYDFRLENNKLRIHDIGDGTAFSLVREAPARR